MSSLITYSIQVLMFFILSILANFILMDFRIVAFEWMVYMIYFVLNLLSNGVSDVFPYACTLCLPLTIAFALLDYKQGVLVMNMTPLEINCVLYT